MKIRIAVTLVVLGLLNTYVKRIHSDNECDDVRFWYLEEIIRGHTWLYWLLKKYVCFAKFFHVING